MNFIYDLEPVELTKKHKFQINNGKIFATTSLKAGCKAFVFLSRELFLQYNTTKKSGKLFLFC